jgi:hypothetical protein
MIISKSTVFTFITLILFSQEAQLARVHYKVLPIAELIDTSSTILLVQMIDPEFDQVVVKKNGQKGPIKLNFRTIKVLKILKAGSGYFEENYKIVGPPSSGFHPLEFDFKKSGSSPGLKTDAEFKDIQVGQILSITSQAPLRLRPGPEKSYVVNELPSPAKPNAKEALFFGGEYCKDLSVFFGKEDFGLIDKNEYPQIITSIQLRLFFDAVRDNSTELLKKAIDNNSTLINAIDPIWGSPLHFAARYGNKEMIETLIKNGAKSDTLNAAGNNALQDLVQSGFVDKLKYLIHFGLNLNSKNSQGQTALHLAVSKNSSDAVQILLEHGADRSLRNAEGKTALELAKSSDNQKLIEALEQ